MPPGRKSTSTSSKSSSSINGQLSPIKSIYGRQLIFIHLDSFECLISDCGSIVWCKYKKYPYWPGIIWEKMSKSTRTQYDILFFGTFSLGM